MWLAPASRRGPNALPGTAARRLRGNGRRLRGRSRRTMLASVGSAWAKRRKGPELQGFCGIPRPNKTVHTGPRGGLDGGGDQPLTAVGRGSGGALRARRAWANAVKRVGRRDVPRGHVGAYDPDLTVHGSHPLSLQRPSPVSPFALVPDGSSSECESQPPMSVGRMRTHHRSFVKPHWTIVALSRMPDAKRFLQRRRIPSLLARVVSSVSVVGKLIGYCPRAG